MRGEKEEDTIGEVVVVATIFLIFGTMRVQGKIGICH